MTSKRRIYVLQLKRKKTLLDNLHNVLDFVNRCSKKSIICTSDLVLSGFALDDLERVADFSNQAIGEYLKVTQDKTLITSLIEKKDNRYFNSIKVISDGKIIYSQHKVKPFPLVCEADFMSFGSMDEVGFFDIQGIKCAVINCYELRFVEMWQKVRGAEIIFVIAQWDKERKQHFETLSQALALMNQCYVVASDCANMGASKASAIINPFGLVNQDGKKGVIYMEIDLSKVGEMRNFLKVGLED
ncbi:hypothetical protein BBW65_00470 [Helicobacter enhydrae]|uniref:CN hydrolase domain-containing protein n=1 Tax=Helicobacter enhydrae TaxID=222136 RepID=A0A1B1U3M3_9HELI|nr:nitrilase-related carbon-nitrogen hydrolase [Helicobacter enhydrae]ANV97384.1 hypothetical protein BBW65_00470 [Helicobacter enhydrae]